MHFYSLRSILPVLALLFGLGSAAAAAPQFTLQDLGTLTPGGKAQPQGVNQAGQVFGTASPSTTNSSLPQHVFFWSLQGGMIDIGALPDNRSATAYPAEGPRSAVAMNDQGQIVGQSEVQAVSPAGQQFGGVNHAFLWTPAPDRKSGTMQDLGTLVTDSQADIGTTAVAINTHGQVTGTATSLTLTAQGYRNINPAHGYLWTPGGTDGVPSNPQMKDLGYLVPSLLDEAGRVIGLLNGVVTVYDGQNLVSLGDPNGFNPNGQYSGYRLTFLRTDGQGNIYGSFSTPTQASNPFVWVADSPGATMGHFVLGPSSNSTVVPPGTVTDAQLPVGAQVFWAGNSVFAFDPANMTVSAVDLGGLIFDPFSLTNSAFPAFSTYPTAVNAAGDLVGISYLSNTPSDAFLEQGGLMYDLNRHIQGPGAGLYQLLEAVGINDGGQIAAFGQPAGNSQANFRAFLLTPAGQAAPVPPTIQLIQPQPPDEGDPDQRVDIAGTGFQVGATVTYDGSPLTATVYAETQILAVIPAADLTAGTHTVTVINPGGQSGSGPYVVLPLRPVPTLTAVSPTSLPAGSPDTAITLTGTGLYPETQIAFGYTPPGQTPLAVLSTSADHTQITVRLLASQMTDAATLAFYARTPGQRGAPQSTAAPKLTILNPAPAITGITPASLPADSVSGFTLTINGTWFVPGTNVRWNGRTYPATFVSPTQVTALIFDSYYSGLPGPGTIAPGPVTVSVVNAAPGGGTDSTVQTITDGPNPVPVLTGVSPGILPPVRSSLYLTLTGSQFMHHSVVHIGSKVFTPATLSDDRTQMQIYLPSSVVLPLGVSPVTVVNPGPGGGTSAPQFLIVQGTRTTTRLHLLWANTDGTAWVWNYNAAGAMASQSYGPFPGWTAKAIAEGPDGHVRLLWTNTDGRMALWNLADANPAATCLVYGPYAGWTATALAVGPDNAAHLLWDTADGQVSLWNMNDPRPSDTCLLYGPYAGWTGTAIALGPDGRERLLWSSTGGQMALWNLADANPPGTALVYGPYAGWTATDLAVGTDNAAHLLWDNMDGHVSLWNMNDASPAGSALLYGPYAGWSGKRIAVDVNGQERLLWTHSDGSVSLWNLADANPAASCLVAGPYPGWTAVGLAAGP